MSIFSRRTEAQSPTTEQVLSEPATHEACARDYAGHDELRQADATTQRALTRAAGQDAGKTWRGRRR